MSDEREIVVLSTNIMVMVLLLVNIMCLLTLIKYSKPTHKVIQIQPIVFEIVFPQQVQMEELTENKVDRPREKSLVSRGLPLRTAGKFKSYMDYRTITNQSSKQWELQQQAETDEEGFRKYDGKYMVAVGSYYAKECGKELEITLDSGIVIEAIVSDLKQDRHTDESNMFVPKNGNIVEFIVDTKKLSKQSLKMGDVSYSGLPGSIISIKEVKNID